MEEMGELSVDYKIAQAGEKEQWQWKWSVWEECKKQSFVKAGSG